MDWNQIIKQIHFFYYRALSNSIFSKLRVKFISFATVFIKYRADLIYRRAY